MHITATLSPGTNGSGLLTLNVNGEARASNMVPIPRTLVRSRCYIGRSNWAGDELFAGRMPEVRLWNLARPAASTCDMR